MQSESITCAVAGLQMESQLFLIAESSEVLSPGTGPRHVGAQFTYELHRFVQVRHVSTIAGSGAIELP
jgi:hypothetical protein